MACTTSPTWLGGLVKQDMRPPAAVWLLLLPLEPAGLLEAAATWLLLLLLLPWLQAAPLWNVAVTSPAPCVSRLSLLATQHHNPASKPNHPVVVEQGVERCVQDYSPHLGNVPGVPKHEGRREDGSGVGAPEKLGPGVVAEEEEEGQVAEEE